MLNVMVDTLALFYYNNTIQNSSIDPGDPVSF